jgi:excisionase family DNA binding protein
VAVSGEPELLRIPQVAQILGVSKRQAYDWVVRGILPGVVRAGRAVYVRKQPLERWLQGHAEAASFGGDGPAAHAGVEFDGGAPRPGYSSCSRNTRETVQSGQNDDLR